MKMIQLKNSSLTVKIKREGAELCSIKNADGLEFLWQAEQTVWARHAPILFPIVGRLKNDGYTFEGSTYAMPQHGFARDQTFELLQASDDAATFLIASNEQSKINFPFDFQLFVRYTLNQNRITISHEVRNIGQKDLYFSLGAHPGFRCPLLPQERMENYYLEFENDVLQITQLNGGLRTSETKTLPLQNKSLGLNSKLFDQDAIVLENHQVNQICLKSNLTAHYLKMTCKGWPFFGIWSKKGSQDFICLEPWCGIADAEDSTGALNQKKGIQKLGPQAQFSCEYSIELA